MSNTEDSETPGLRKLSSDIVSAYVSNNAVKVDELPALIRSVHSTLTGLNGGAAPATPQTAQRPPAVPVKKSVTPDYVICLEDGKKLKMLKRYLRSRYGLSPEDYRAKWGLPPDYPMVAPNYSERRSDFAKKIGLGKNSTGRGKSKKKSR